LTDWVDHFDFTLSGAMGSLGRDIAMKVVDEIYQRSMKDRAGVTGIWLANEPKYAKWKLKNYGVDEPNSRTGQMLSQLSLYGRTRIEPKQITMIYGTNTPPVGGTFGTVRPELLVRDQKRTDTQKAYYAHTGQSKHKIKRPFYDVDQKIGTAVAELATNRLIEYVNATNHARGLG
jgi:hypothetical protein